MAGRGIFGRRAWLALLGLVAAVAVYVSSGGGGGAVYATGNDLWDDGYACFVSGQPRDVDFVHGENLKQGEGVGFGRDEHHILERQDLTSLLGGSWAGSYQSNSGEISYFERGFAQAVDWLYAMYPSDYQFDGRAGSHPQLDDNFYDFFLWTGGGKDMDGVCSVGGGDCHIGPSPTNMEIKIGNLSNVNEGEKRFDNIGDYLDRRATARYYQEPVKSLVAAWHDPRKPEGGLRVNQAAIARDDTELQKRFAESTNRSVVYGNRVLSGTNEVPYVLINGTLGSTCTGGATTNCTTTGAFDSTQETATVQQVTISQSNDENFGDDVSDDLNTGNVDARASGVGYEALGQEDTGDDALFVSLVLDDRFRGDFMFDVSGEDGGRRGLAAFGLEPWTYENAYGGRDPRTLTWERHRYLFTGTVDSRENVIGDAAHYGYRQPTIGSAWTKMNEEDVGDGDYPGWRAVAIALAKDEDVFEQTRESDLELMEEWRRVRWPVNFEDLNWYMYELPGGDFYDQLSLFWMSAEGISGLVGSGYVEQEVDQWRRMDGDELECGFRDGDDNLLYGDALKERFVDVGVVDGVECDGDAVKSLGHSGTATLEKWDRGTIEGGNYRNRVGFFPFQVNRSSGDGWNDLRRFEEGAFSLDAQSIAGMADAGTEGWYVLRASRIWRELPHEWSPRGVDGEGHLVLVKAGVERPVDADGAVGNRALNRFEFVIDEAEQFNSGSINSLDDEGKRRFGFPKNEGLVPKYVAQWPFQPIDPNRPYLMVFTYYEATHDGSVTFKMRDDQRDPDNAFHDHDLKVPRRYMRRVICRAIVLPSGYSPVVPAGGFMGAVSQAWSATSGFFVDKYEAAERFVSEGVGYAKKVIETAGDVLSAVFEPAKWIGRLLDGFATMPRDVAERGVGISCDGADVVDDYMEPREGALDEPATLVTEDGVMVENHGVVAKTEFEDDCLGEGRSLDDGVLGGTLAGCLPASRVSGSESCADLPKFRLVLNGRGLDQQSAGAYVDYEPRWVHPPPGLVWEFDNRTISNSSEGVGDFDFVHPITEAQIVDRLDGVAPSAYNLGLSRVRVGFAHEWSDVPDGIADGIDGFVVQGRPDQRAWDSEDEGVLGDRLPLFYLPLNAQVYPKGSVAAGEGRKNLQVDGFYFGSLSDSSVYADYEEENCDYLAGGVRRSLGVDDCVLSLGATGTQDHMNRFFYFLDQLPVAPTFEHAFRVRAFRGQGPPGDREVGPWSDWLTVSGHGRWLCDMSLGPDTDHIKWAYGCTGVPAPPGADPYDNRGAYGRVIEDEGWSGFDPVAASALGSIAGYRFSVPLLQAGGRTGLVEDSDVRVGLLDLSGTDICGDLFSSTPGALTWDNKAVQFGWQMTRVLAGALLFVLLVWHGLRMTYDTWLVGRVSTALRDMLPRFLIAVILVMGSLFICRMVIVLVSDLTCFVAHSTGMTFWGVLGNSFVNIMKGFGQLFTNSIGEGLALAGLAAVLFKFKLFVLLWFFVFWIAVVIIMMIRVAYHMLLRLALIAICIVMSPVAFALYASPDTAHWTGKWLRLFFGALAQQVVTLIVLYTGASFIRGVDSEGFGEWGLVLISSFLTIAMFALAIKVPRIINPDGEGFFAEFSGLMRMGAAAATFVASAFAGGVGAVAGGGTFTTGGGGGLTPPGAVSGPGSPVLGGGAPQAGGSGGQGGQGGGGTGWFSRAGSAVLGGLRPNMGGGPGLGSRLASQQGPVGRFVVGMGEGARRGQRMSNMMRNITEGHFMFRNMGVGDDAANRLEDLSSQLGSVQPRPEGSEAQGEQRQVSGQRSRRRRRRGR